MYKLVKLYFNLKKEFEMLQTSNTEELLDIASEMILNYTPQVSFKTFTALHTLYKLKPETDTGEDQSYKKVLREIQGIETEDEDGMEDMYEESVSEVEVQVNLAQIVAVEDSINKKGVTNMIMSNGYIYEIPMSKEDLITEIYE